MQWVPTDRLTVNLGVAWLDTEITDWDAVDRDASAWPVTVTHDVSGAELSQSPEWQYNATLKYEWPLGDALVMEAAGDVSYTDETTGGINPEEATEDYAIFGAAWLLALPMASGEPCSGRATSRTKTTILRLYRGNGPFVRSYGMPRTYAT